MLYLAGVTAITWASNPLHRPPFSHLVGLAALAVLTGLALAGEIPLLAVHLSTEVYVNDPGCPLDVDTPDDLKKLDI